MAEFIISNKGLDTVLGNEVYQVSPHVSSRLNTTVYGVAVSLFILMSSPDSRYQSHSGVVIHNFAEPVRIELLQEQYSQNIFEVPFAEVNNAALKIERNSQFSKQEVTYLSMWKSFQSNCKNKSEIDHFGPIFSILSTKLQSIESSAVYVDVVPSLDMLDFNLNIGNGILVSVCKKAADNDDIALCSVTVNRKLLVETELPLDTLVEKIHNIQEGLA